MSNVPAELVDLALNALEDEVPCWRKLPWRPGYVRLMRFPPMDALIGESDIDVDGAQEVITYHDVPADIADDMIVRFAMEKALEAAIAARRVNPEIYAWIDRAIAQKE